MMFKYSLLILFFLYNILTAQTIEELNKDLRVVKGMIKTEEILSKKAEKSILEDYTFINEGDSNLTLGYQYNTKFFATNTPHLIMTLFNSSFLNKASNSKLKALYENNSLRTRTYIEKTATNEYKIYFIFKDEVAKILQRMFYLQGGYSLTHSAYNQFLVGKDNINRGITNHLSVYNKTNGFGDAILLYYVHKDKILTGPYIINKNMLSSYNTNKALYDFIPNGVLIYDTKGKRYTKSSNGIEELK